MKLKAALLITLLFTVFGVVSCGGGSSGSDGTLTIRLSDAPMEGVTSVWIKFSAIEVKPADGPSITFDLSETGAIDLVTLQDGVRATLLDAVSLPAGEYNWIRLHVDLLDEGALPPGGDFAAAGVCYVEANGESYPLYIPSGEQTGLKLNRGFNVPVGGGADFTLDFDLTKSLRFWNDDSDYYRLKPVIRVSDNTVVGSIAGTILNKPEGMACQEGAVYLFNGPDATPADISDAPGDPIAVFKTREYTEGVCGYRALYLEPGTYTLAFTWDVASDDPDLSDTLVFLGTGDADVAAETETTFDIDVAEDI